MKVKIINESTGHSATREVNDFLAGIEEDGHRLLDIIYKPVALDSIGFNCIMIKYEEINES